MNSSEKLRIVVVGASAAGLRAAARAKRLMPNAEITVIDQAKIISYGACGLPYYLSGDIESPLPLRTTMWGTLRDEAFFKAVKGLDVQTGISLVKIEAVEKRIQCIQVDTGDFVFFNYDKLVLATGASPILLPGIKPTSKRISAFKTIEDAKKWRDMLERNQLSEVAIIGSGFIGIELAEAFTSLWGCAVNIIEAQDRVLPQMLDREMSALVESHLIKQGVNVHTNSPVTGIIENEDGLEITMKDKTIKVPYAIMGLGVRPKVEYLRGTQIKIGLCGGIVVDEHLKTAEPDIYAAGDCIEVTMVAGNSAVVPLGSLANKQGRALGNILAGRDATFRKVAGSTCVKVFDFNVASTGLTEARAREMGFDAKAVWGPFSDIAHYYPEGNDIDLKLVYDGKTRKLLGLQAVGEGEVVKRVDVFGNLLLRDGVIEDLFDLEFAYSPPYSPALDPLFVLGAIAANQEDDALVGLSPSTSFEGFTLVDVRTEEEADSYPIVEGMTVIPIEEFRGRIQSVPEGETVLVVCARGTRSSEAARMLMQFGRTGVFYLSGGMKMKS